MISDADFLEAHAALVSRWLSPARVAAGLPVHGLGVGMRHAPGRLTSERAVRVYTGAKLPRRMLAPRDRVPSAIDGVPIDVIEAPPAFVHNAPVPRHRQVCRPVFPGISIGRDDVPFGTIGAFGVSQRPEDAGRMMLLSNRHVLVGPRGGPGDAIYQPGPGDPAGALMRIGSVFRAWPIEPGSVPNQVDAAMAELSGVDHDLEIPRAGRILGSRRAREQTLVCKFGRTSGYTEGFISDVHCIEVVGLERGDPSRSALFVEQIRVERSPGVAVFGDHGDSGALLMEQGTGQAVGLYFAGPADGSYGLANHIAQVTERLQMTLLTAPVPG